jgi:asparagine synthase (glutamine-hydrolysing)
LGSDEILDTAPLHIGDLLRAGRGVAACREALRWARAHNLNVWTLLTRCGLEPLLPTFSREGFGPLWRGGYGSWPRLGWFTIPPWVNRGFARRHGLRQRGAEHRRAMFASPINRSLELAMLRTTAGDWARWHLAAALGLDITHPFRDPRLVLYALGIPAAFKAIAGRTKPVLQEAMKGVLPEPIRTRFGKCSFDDAYGLGLRQYLRPLEDLVRRSRIRELGLFDADELIRVMREASVGVGDVIARERMDKSLALIQWHDRLDPANSVDISEILAAPEEHGYRTQALSCEAVPA